MSTEGGIECIEYIYMAHVWYHVYSMKGVYMVECDGLYKIGVANNFLLRLGTLRGTCPRPVTTIGVIEGATVKDEQEWHHKFRSKRKHGEWFALDSAEVETFRQNCSWTYRVVSKPIEPTKEPDFKQIECALRIGVMLEHGPILSILAIRELAKLGYTKATINLAKKRVPGFRAIKAPGGPWSWMKLK